MIVYSYCPEDCMKILPKNSCRAYFEPEHIVTTKIRKLSQWKKFILYLTFNVANNNINYIIRKGYVNMKSLRLYLNWTCILLGHLRKANYH